MRFQFSILFLLLVIGCQPSPAEDAGVVSEDLSLSVLRGAFLFEHETFDGNGRTCGTCHILGLGTHSDLSPADVEAEFAADPTGPLFRSIDSDDGVGSDYTLLRRDATVRIPFTLPPGVWVEEPDGPHVRHNTDGTTTVWVRRSTPTVENIIFENAIMWDGREGADLEQQAISAVLAHNEPGRLPTAAEAADLAAFQEATFSSLRLRFFANGGPAPTLPPGLTASQQRGREFFVSQGPIDATHRGLCATCHSGDMLNSTDAFNPVQGPGERFTNNFVSETNMLFGNGYEELTYHFPSPLPFGPPEIVLRSSDPGRLLVTGNPCEVFLSCIINPGSTVSLFKIPTLWGTASTAPYFHDNSAASLEEVMDLYQFLFAVTAQGTGNPAFVITPQDREDILAYMRLAFR